MHTVARYSAKAAQANPIVGRIYDSAGDKVRWSFPDLSKFTAQAETYVSSPWVNIAISLIAQTAALVNLNVFKLNGEDKDAISNHPLEALMRKPNDHMSQFEFMYALITTRRLTGNAYIYLSSMKGGAPDELLLLRPDLIRIVPGTNGKRINGYAYEVNGYDAIPLEPETVIHWKRFHPTDPYYGLSDVQVIALSIQADKGMSTWQAKFFSKENAVPAGLVSVPPTMSNQDYEDLKSSWYRNYGGTQRATAIIRGTDVKYQNIGTSHVDMDFGAGRLFEKEVIFNKLGIPLSIFAVNANEANARAGMELLTGNVVWPEMVDLSQKFTSELLPFWGDNLVVEPDDIRIKDEKAELQRLNAYSPYRTINEVRSDRGDDPVPWGDYSAPLVVSMYGGPNAAQGALGSGSNVQQTQSQVDSELGSNTRSTDIAEYSRLLELPPPGYEEAKGLETDAQRRWFFANNPEYAANPRAGGRANWKNVANGGSQMGKDYAKENFPVGTQIAFSPGPGIHEKTTSTFEVTGHSRLSNGNYTPKLAQTSGAPLSTGSHGSYKPLNMTDLERHGNMYQNAFMTRPELHITRPSSASKAISIRDDYAPTTHTRAAEAELFRFVRFAGKRLWRGDFAAAKAVEDFTFTSTPPAYQMLVRSYGDTAKDADELGRMVDVLCDVVVKGLTPATDRVSARGRLDPLAKEKSAYANKLQSVTASYLTGLKGRIIEHAQHAPSSGFWAGEQQHYAGDVGGTVKAGLQALMAALAALSAMQYGVSLDEAGLKTDVEGLFTQWIAETPGQITSTTAKGVTALYQRWKEQPDANVDDLISALNDSYLFSPERSDLIAETETTDAGAQVTRLTGQDMAKSLNVPFMNDDVAGPPLHGDCRCFETTYIVMGDDGDPSGIDRIWHTVNDSHVCPNCSPLDGQTFSDIGGGA